MLGGQDQPDYAAVAVSVQYGILKPQISDEAVDVFCHVAVVQDIGRSAETVASRIDSDHGEKISELFGRDIENRHVFAVAVEQDDGAAFPFDLVMQSGPIDFREHPVIPPSLSAPSGIKKRDRKARSHRKRFRGSDQLFPASLLLLPFRL